MLTRILTIHHHHPHFSGGKVSTVFDLKKSCHIHIGNYKNKMSKFLTLSTSHWGSWGSVCASLVKKARFLLFCRCPYWRRLWRGGGSPRSRRAQLLSELHPDDLSPSFLSYAPIIPIFQQSFLCSASFF